MFRIVDGLNVINGGEFKSNFKDVCPEELQLKKENSDGLEASFFGFTK